MEWLKCMPYCTANFLPLGVSDHSPAVLVWNEVPKKVSSFIFNNKWTVVIGFKPMVEKAWHIEVEGDPMSRVKAMLNNTKAKLKTWAATNVPDIKRKIK